MKIILIRIGKIFLLLNVIILFVIFYSNWRIERAARKYLYNEVSKLPINKVGLVFGTSQYLKRGVINPYSQYRIEATAMLYKAKKIKYILVSGYREKYYNEPDYMKAELLKAGVPAKAIFLDYEGNRTFDSILRCAQIYGQNKFTIISQQFQNERALYIAKNYGISAIGFNAQDVGTTLGYITILRECLARVKVLIDIHLMEEKLHTKDKKVIIK